MENIFMPFDTEFTGLKNGTKLISIGAAIDFKFFYGEIKGIDYESPDIDEGTKEFLKKEVIPGLMFNPDNKDNIIENSRGSMVVFGDMRFVANNMVTWISSFMKSKRQIIIPVSDVMCYDMVLLMELLSYADRNPLNVDIKNAISPAGIDINNDIAKYKQCDVYTAFDISREDLYEEILGGKPVFPGKKHNALTDARIINALFNYFSLIRRDKLWM